MNWSFIIKINVLLLAFIGVIFIMRQMQTTGATGLAALMGAPPPATPTVTGATTTLDWCDTRVVAIERPEKPALRQEKLKWFSAGDELEFLPVEKWFGRNCRVRIERARPEEFATEGAKPVMVVKFIKGEPETLFVAQDVFRWRQELFRSAELAQALADLDALPKTTRH